jgi:mono/diheme cytochrome c family protein
MSHGCDAVVRRRRDDAVRAMRPLASIAMIGVGLASSTAAAADGLHGKRLYLDAARLVGSGVSCVDCHGGLPGGAHAIEAAANDPARIARAIESVPQMAPLRGRLTAEDLADLAAYLGAPDVASPEPRLPGRLDFGSVPVDGEVIATAELGNAGALPFELAGSGAVLGDDELALIDTTCAPGPLAPGQTCALTIRLRAGRTLGLRTARLVVPHDWVYGQSAMAIIATVTPRTPPSPEAGCAITGMPGPLLVLLVLCRRRRPTGSRPGDPPRSSGRQVSGL